MSKHGVKTYIARDTVVEFLKQRYSNFRNLASAGSLSVVQVNKIFGEREGISLFLADKVARAYGYTRETMFEEFDVPFIAKDVNHMVLSEQLLTGFKTNIENRLKGLVSTQVRLDIMGLIDDIIIEASYLGVECQKNDKADFIIKAAQRRRND